MPLEGDHHFEQHKNSKVSLEKNDIINVIERTEECTYDFIGKIVFHRWFLERE